MTNSRFAKFAAGISAMVLVPQVAMAQDSVPWLDLYVSGAAGASISSSFEGNNEAPGQSLPFSGDFEAAGLVRIAVGNSFGSAIRAEVEMSYRGFEFEDNIIGSSGNPIDSAGSARTTALMVNALYDIPLGTSPYSIYVGGGLGTARVEVDLRRGPSNPTFVLTEGDFTALAGQLRLGAERELNNGMTVFADYSYFQVSEQRYTTFNSAGVTFFEQDFGPIQSHELGIGIRMQF